MLRRADGKVQISGHRGAGRMRQRVRYWKRVIRALVVDPRLPHWMRGMVAVSLAIKAVPYPDFGVDELLLAIVALLLATRYRSVWRQIRLEAQTA